MQGKIGFRPHPSKPRLIMHLLSRKLIFVCSFVLVCLLITGTVRGQINSGHAIIDHSSMSPDSWSAPPVRNAIPFIAPNAVPATAATNGLAERFNFPNDTTVASPRHPLATSGQLEKSVLSGPTSPRSASPSIPNLNAATANDFRLQTGSLLRQPGDTVKSPFQQAKYRQSSTASLPSSGSNQDSIPNPFLSGTGTPGAIPLTNTDKLGFAPTAENNFPATNLTHAPTVSSPTVSGTLAPNDRYPLGINSGSLLATPESPTLPHADFIQQPIIQQPVIQQPVIQQAINGLPTFRPDLGHRTPNPTFRGRDHDSGLKLDFEDKKKEYPGLGEILATGRYFGSVSALVLQPAFQQNSVITEFNSSASAATFASSQSFDFDYEGAPRLRLGFESRFGPGVELDYWQYDQGSNVSEFTSNGSNSGQLSSGLFGPSTLTTLEAVNAGDRLSAVHSIDIETFSVTFFKEIKFPISRLNGMFGFQYASVFQELDAELTDAGGNITGAIRSTSDLRAYGPKVRFEYYRPIGHTKLEFITAFGGSVLFGERDQIVTNLQTPAVNRFGADEYVLTSDFYGGVQWKKQTAENRGYYARIGITHQSWVGGGSAVSSESNFGLRGFAFEVGLNR